MNLIVATRIEWVASPHLKITKRVMINFSTMLDPVEAPTITCSVYEAGLSKLTGTVANASDEVRFFTVVPRLVQPSLQPCLENETIGVAEKTVLLASDRGSYTNRSTIDLNVCLSPTNG